MRENTYHGPLCSLLGCDGEEHQAQDCELFEAVHGLRCLM